MHSFCKLKVAHLTVTKNLMMKTLPDMGSPTCIYSWLQGKQKISFYISFLFFAVFTDGLVFDVILILAVTHQTLFVGFFFLVAYWWFLVERNVGVRRIDRPSTLKKPQSPPPQKNVFTHVASSNANLLQKNRSYIRKRFNSYRTGLEHQHGRRFIVLERFWLEWIP